MRIETPVENCVYIDIFDRDLTLLGQLIIELGYDTLCSQFEGNLVIEVKIHS